MNANGTSLSFKQAHVEKPTSSVDEAILLSNHGNTIERLLKENQVTTYLGKMNTYEARMRVLDTRGEAIGSEFLENVTLDISPSRNGAGVLTTINGTYFDDPEAGSHAMEFVDVKNENSNPVRFAFWDPSFKSYNFSMTGKVAGRSYTFERQIIVQIPSINFLGNQSECNSLYNQTSNFINSTCSSVYNISASYDMKYRFLQIYKNTSGNVSASTVYSFLNVSNPLLYCTQSSANATCQNFDAQTSGVIPNSTQVQAVGHMGFSYFSAPYLSPKTCYPNVTDTTQIFKASAYDYGTSIENYLLVKGTQDSDQWVPLRKSDVTITLGGTCSGEDPCGMGVSLNYTKPWSVKNSSFSPHDDSKWWNGTSALSPKWNGTTGNTQEQEKKLCVTTYVTIDEKASDPNHIYWYFCNFTTSTFDSGGMKNGVFLSDLGGTNNLFAGKAPEDQVIETSPGVPANYSLYSGSNESPWYFGLNTPLNVTKIRSEIHNITGYTSDGARNVFVKNDASGFGPGILVDLVLPFETNKGIARVCTVAKKAKGTEKFMAITLVIAALIVIGSAAAAEDIKKKVDEKKEEEKEEEKDDDGKAPILIIKSESLSVDTLSVIYDQYENLNYIESLIFKYEVNVKHADKLKDDRLFGTSCVISNGSLWANAEGASPYLVYDFSNTGDKTVQNVQTIEKNGDSSQKIITTCTLVFPKLYTVPAYANQCEFFSSYNIINFYQWTPLRIYSQLFMKTSPSDDGPWISEREAQIIETYDDIYLTCISGKGCGFGIKPYYKFWFLPKNYSEIKQLVEYLDQNQFHPNKNTTEVEEDQKYVRVYIDPNASNKAKNEGEEEFWTMCPAKTSLDVFSEIQGSHSANEPIYDESQANELMYAESHVVEIM